MGLAHPSGLTDVTLLRGSGLWLFPPGLLVLQAGTPTIRKVIPFQQTPAFVMPDLPCAISPILRVASLDSWPDSSVMPLPHPARGPVRDHLSPSSQALDAHTDSTDIPVLFVFRISNFFIIFFRFGLDFFLYSFLPWGCVFHLSICLQPPLEFSGKYSLNFCCVVFFLSQ